MALSSRLDLIQITWSELKSFATSKDLHIQYVEDDQRYQIFLVEGKITYATDIWKGTPPEGGDPTQNAADKADFEASYKAGSNAATKRRVVVADGLERGYLAAVDNLNRILVSANVLVPPASIAVNEFYSGSVAVLDIQYYTIPDGKVLTIGSWGGGAEANSGHVTRLELSLDATGTGTPLTKLDEVFVGPGDRNAQRDLSYEITGDANNRIAMVRERLDGGSDLVSIRFDGFRDA